MMMKKHEDISYVIPVILILLCVILWAVSGLFSEVERPDLVKVSVVVENSNSGRWTSFKQGLETAAKDAEVDLTIISTSKFDSVSEEWSLIDQKVNDGAQGIIVAPYNEEGADEYFDSLSWNVSLCLVNSGLDKDESQSNIMTAIPDYDEIAQNILNQIKADYGSDLSGKSVQIMANHAHEKGISYVFKLLEQALTEEQCNTVATAKNAKVQKQLLKRTYKPDIILALDDDALQNAASSLFNDNVEDTRLYGIGISESSIYYLDKGVIKGMIVVDDFNMGYDSLAAVAENIRNKFGNSKTIPVKIFSVRPEDVHNPEIEGILFPVIQ